MGGDRRLGKRSEVEIVADSTSSSSAAAMTATAVEGAASSFPPVPSQSNAADFPSQPTGDDDIPF